MKKNNAPEPDDGKPRAPAGAKLPAIKSPLADFIPYHSHYNPHTLITKNGELLQVIKIASNTLGLNYESGDRQHSTVRETLRAAIQEVMGSDHLGVWLHTVRKRKPIRYGGTLKEPFAAYVHEKWQQKNPWKYQYYNEIYITVLHDGQGTKLMDKETFVHGFLPKRNRNWRNQFLDEAYNQLDATITGMLRSIQQHYNAQRLTIVERIPTDSEISTGQPVFYSELMEFLGTLLNLRAESHLLPELDLSVALARDALTFGFNALEVKSAGGKRRFAAVVTLKQYREVPADTADLVLQAPIEFIISQAFNFIPHDKALNQYREQKELFDISGDKYSITASGLDEMLRSNKRRPTDFGEHQTSIMVMVDDYKHLDAEVGKVQSAFSELGLLTIREDLKLEECFWAQLPGNYEFIRRKDTINTSRMAGFSRLNRFPNGIDTGNHWGSAVTLMPTQVNSPYFFNFHFQDNGHTAIFDYNSFGDAAGQVMLYFLLTESRKYNGKLFIFDRDRSARLFFHKVGGDYHEFANAYEPPENSIIRLNPFRLEPTPRNLSFLLAWLGALIAPGATLPETQKEVLRSGIEAVYGLPEPDRHLLSLIDHVRAADAPLAEAFARWHGYGKLAGIFDGPQETMNLEHLMHAFDLSPILKHEGCVIPVFSYLLHKVISDIDGRPTIIVLHEAWDLLENAFFAPRLESLMQMLKANNAILIFTSKNPNACVDSHIFPTVMSGCATHLYLPDDIRLPYTSEALNLTEADARLLQKMDRQKGDFLLHQNRESIALRCNVTVLEDAYAIFGNDIKNLASAGGKFASVPNFG